MKLNGVNIILYAALLRLSRPILSAPPSIAQDAGVPAGGSAGGGKDAITSRSSSIDANLANIVDPCSNLTRLNGISPYQVQEAVPEVDITGGIRGKDEDATSFEVVSDVIQGASQQCCPKSSTEESVYAMLYKAACIFSVIFHILYIAQRIFGSPFRTRPSNDSSGTDGLSDALDSTSIIDGDDTQLPSISVTIDGNSQETTERRRRRRRRRPRASNVLSSQAERIPLEVLPQNS